MSTTRELIKARYARIRAALVASHGVVDHIPPLDEVDEAEWDKDVAYLAKQRKGRSFCYSRLDTPEGTDETISLNPVEKLEDLFRHLKDGTTVAELRPATEEEVVEFVLSGGIEFEAEADAEFQRGWDNYEAP